MYRIALCDDDSAFSAEFEVTVKKALEERDIPYELNLFSDAASLLAAMRQEGAFDLIFLDILLETANGIAFAKLLRKQDWNTDIIFVTSSRDYAIAGYDANPLNYLVKPVDPKKLSETLEAFIKKNRSQYICIQTPNRILHLRTLEILYFEIYSHQIIIHMTDGTKTSFMGTLKNIEEQLPPVTFLRPHRSYLVNMNHIVEITRYRLRLSSGEILPISKALYQKAQYGFIHYASQKAPL